MSQVSQTPGECATPGRIDRLRLSLILVAFGVIVPIAMLPVRRYVWAAVDKMRLHGPDLALINALSPVIKIHLFAALAAIALGAALMWVRKGQTFHRIAGWGWVLLVFLVAGSSIFITSLNHGRWSLLHLFTGWTLIILPLAVFAAKRSAIGRHRRTMTGLFYGGFAINLAVAFIPGRTLWNVFFG